MINENNTHKQNVKISQFTACCKTVTNIIIYLHNLLDDRIDYMDYSNLYTIIINQ